MDSFKKLKSHFGFNLECWWWSFPRKASLPSLGKSVKLICSRFSWIQRLTFWNLNSYFSQVFLKEHAKENYEKPAQINVWIRKDISFGKSLLQGSRFFFGEYWRAAAFENYLRIVRFRNDNWLFSSLFSTVEGVWIIDRTRTRFLHTFIYID